MNDHLARLESSGSLLRPTAAVSAGETAQQQRPFWDSFSSSVPPKFAQQKPVQFSDEQIMYDYKCFPCSKNHSHDWSQCPYTHPNDKVRRRSPRVYSYSSVVCPTMKEFGSCPRGDLCHLSHSVWEYWLHPDRYHTEMCRAKGKCDRKVCFFAHTLVELRKPMASNAYNHRPQHGSIAAAAGAGQGTPCMTIAASAVEQGTQGSSHPPALTISTVQHSGMASMSAAQQGCLSSNASVSTPCTATGLGYSPMAADGSSSSATTTPLHQHHMRPCQPRAHQHSNLRPRSHQPFNRQHVRARQQQPQPPQVRPEGQPAAPLMLPSGLMQGMLANAAVSPAYPDTAAVLAAMQQLQGGMAGMGVSAVPAVQAPPAAALALDSFPGAAAASQLLVQPGVLQYAQRLGINSINASQPMVCISNSQGTVGNHSVLVQHGGAPVAVNLGAAGTWGASMAPAGQFPPGIVYQHMPGAGSLEPVPMQQQQLLQQQPQLVLVPFQQLGAQAASTYGQELVAVPVSVAPGGVGTPLQHNITNMQHVIGA